jgi:hypothetical protein
MLSFLTNIQYRIKKKYHRYLGPYRDVIVVSYPKSGRTWLRVILEKLNIIIPYKHDETEIVKQLPLDSLSQEKSHFANNRIIFLVRDPRDTVVSSYYQAVKRQQMYEGSISDFIRDERFGIKKILKFHEVWNENQHVPKDFMLLRYEDMQEDINTQVKRILSFLNKSNVKEERIREATEFGKFDNMHKLEQKGTFNKKYKGILNPTDTSDKTSYKTRKGKVGGFYEDLSAEDLEYCNSLMKSMKNPFYQDRI